MESDVKEDMKSECPWRVDEEDEARYNFSNEKGLWQPKPEDILSMFDQLSKGGALTLQWTCPGRRAPESEEESDKREEMGMEVDKDESREEEERDPEPCAFDFDDTQSDTSVKTTPIRALGGPGRTPRTEKRVARMDNIMDSLRKQQIQRAAEREARKAKVSPGRTPPARGRLLKFGSPLAQNSKLQSSEGPVIKTKAAPPVTAIGTVTATAKATAQTQPSLVSTGSESSTSSIPSTAKPVTSVMSSVTGSFNTTSVNQPLSLNSEINRNLTSESEDKTLENEQMNVKDNSVTPTVTVNNEPTVVAPVSTSITLQPTSNDSTSPLYSAPATVTTSEISSNNNTNTDQTMMSNTVQTFSSSTLTTPQSTIPSATAPVTSTSFSFTPFTSSSSLSTSSFNPPPPPQPIMSTQNVNPEPATSVSSVVSTSSVTVSENQPEAVTSTTSITTTTTDNVNVSTAVSEATATPLLAPPPIPKSEPSVSETTAASPQGENGSIKDPT